MSIVDYLKQINRAVNDGDHDAYRLPDSEQQVAQYLLLYLAGGSRDDLEHVIDYGYRLVNIHLTMNSGLYSDQKVVVEEARRYIAELFNATGIRADLAGRVYLDYHWLK